MKGLKVNINLQKMNFNLHCHFKIPSAAVVVLLGASGCGKTSLLRAIAGLETPASGSIYFDQRCWFDSNSHKNLAVQKRKVGMVFQDYALFEHYSVAKNIAYGLACGQADVIVQEWLVRLRLQKFAQYLPQQLSGGQRQRVALARALAPQPDILLLDEPFSAIDEHLREDLRNQLKQVVNDLQQTVIIVTHDLNEAAYLADYVGVIVDGQLAQFANTEHVFSHPASLAVAKILGWRNFLPIETIENDRVSGSWGSLSLLQPIEKNAAYLSFQPYHINFSANKLPESLAAEVVSVRQLAGLQELLCRLKDGSRLFMHVSWQQRSPVVGSKIYLQISKQYIKTLTKNTEVLSQKSPPVSAIRVAIKEIVYAEKVKALMLEDC